MKIVNTGSKIINIGKVGILPGDTSPELPKEFDNKSLATLERLGFVRIVKETETAPKAPETKTVPKSAKAPAAPKAEEPKA